MSSKAAQMRLAWLDYILSFVFASFGRFTHDWYYASKAESPKAKRELLSAALYSGVTGLAIALIVTWLKPELSGSALVVAISLLAGIGAVDLADVIYTAFRQWARKAAGLEDKEEE